MSTLPEANVDPNIIGAREATVAYQREVDAVRADSTLSDLGKAERIDKLYSTWTELIGHHQEQFYAPRRDRALKLEALVPVGPGVPNDASPADAAVLHQAFNTAFDKAANASKDELQQMYATATRFGDETTLRAVLTAAQDKGLNGIVDQWAAGDPKRQAGLKELGELRELFSGRGTDARFAYQAFNGFGLVRRPPESMRLDTLRAAAAN
ncbi:MAG TPA: hypothetical protein PLZ93_01125 [Nocardioides sp.]|uniref:hypothetical protein n=1 Tax=uncultured Nocardioides sp. TaxID=198441 RepID=UPI000EDBE173|nr:hypothetical protein [uncultured Nocardioides sp.]HCB03141.1 hypothetical protein [Nocardioides sp.]HRD60943.1 hypothetical protein [Nocardioides sp.]HRI94194.1 hypothetical protein [Nocardioides sp.]HRK44168.1 hypothetical protein [Nocardioides sp.]